MVNKEQSDWKRMHGSDILCFGTMKFNYDSSVSVPYQKQSLLFRFKGVDTLERVLLILAGVPFQIYTYSHYRSVIRTKKTMDQLRIRLKSCSEVLTSRDVEPCASLEQSRLVAITANTLLALAASVSMPIILLSTELSITLSRS